MTMERSDNIEVVKPDGSTLNVLFTMSAHQDGSRIISETVDNEPRPDIKVDAGTAEARYRQSVGLRVASLQTRHGTEAVRGPDWLRTLGSA